MGDGKKLKKDPRQAFAEDLEDYVLQQLKDNIDRGTPFMAYRGTVQAIEPQKDDETEFITLRVVFDGNSRVTKDLSDAKKRARKKKRARFMKTLDSLSV